MDGIISINGQKEKEKSANISVFDRGFLFGDQIFEVFVAFDDMVLDIEDHLNRLRNSAAKISITIPWSNEDLKKEIEDLVKEVSFKKSYIRLVVTRGNGLGLHFPEEQFPTKIIYVLKAKIEQNNNKDGILLKTFSSESSRRGAFQKINFYLPSIVSIKKAKDMGYDDIVWLNSFEEITESSVANIFFIGRRGAEIYLETPSLHSGLLPGITRSKIIKIFQKKGLLVEEVIINKEEIAKYDEAFLSSTVRGLVPISGIDNKKFRCGNKSSYSNLIKPAFEEQIKKELGYSYEL